MGEEILHVRRKAHRDGRAPSSVPEGKNHRLRVPSASLPADASAVDMNLYEAQTLADALKWYLQELPMPLIPPALYSDLVHMAQGKHTRAPPTLGTSVGLEKLWEAPASPGCLRPHPLPSAAPRADPEKGHWEHHLCQSSTAAFGRCFPFSGKEGEIQGAVLPPPQRGLLPLQCPEEEVLPARTGSCQGWVMLAPEESIIIIFWLCCLGFFSCNLINSWLYMGTENSQLFQLSAIRKCL